MGFIRCIEQNEKIGILKNFNTWQKKKRNLRLQNRGKGLNP